MSAPPERPLQVVWFKRDLRLHDHAALHHALLNGPVLCLYVLEPSQWQGQHNPDAAAQHLGFLKESLRALYRELQAVGGLLHVAVGELTEVLQALRQQHPTRVVLSHEENGNHPSHRRDRAVRAWCRAHGIEWREFAQFGVLRPLANRDHWARHWAALMGAPQLALPLDAPLHFVRLPQLMGRLPEADEWGLAPVDPPARQRGGRALGLDTLNGFLLHRAARYRGGISSPLNAPEACSRLSPYLSFGCLSLREVVQATRQRAAELPAEAPRWRQGLSAFESRLHWHCHFIQKLESEPEIEWRNMHRGHDGLREDEHRPEHLEALRQGRTGWPMVDACVAMLAHTGWLNFRMRAMLVSVAAYPLWLHWRPVAHWLAQQFLDYEPGIHWSQMQMQSGTTGINSTRVYNPVKQAQDHDPDGHFVRHWLPALRQVPDAWLWMPWQMPPEMQTRCGLRPGIDLPTPLVDLAQATRVAKQRLHARRQQPEVRAAKAAVLAKHGSRARPKDTGRRPRAAPGDAAVQQLPLDW